MLRFLSIYEAAPPDRRIAHCRRIPRRRAASRGATKQFEKSRFTVKVRQPDGTLKAQAFETLSTLHGPVIRRQGGEMVAMRMAALDRPFMLQEYDAVEDMARKAEENAGRVSRAGPLRVRVLKRVPVTSDNDKAVEAAYHPAVAIT